MVVVVTPFTTDVSIPLLDEKEILFWFIILVEDEIPFTLVEIVFPFEEIPFKDIEEWDRTCKDEEQGDNPKAPYHKQHSFATEVESMLVMWMNHKWTKYNKSIYESCRKCSDKKSR